MPLSAPAGRQPLHTRTIAMSGYIRDDGLWDIEGHLVDTKSYDHDNAWRGTVTAGTPVHEMWMRLTLDDDMVIRASEASFENHPFPTCSGTTPNFTGLAGIRIGPGWMREVRRRVGGTSGCTHILEMLSQMGTTAFQTFVAKSRLKGQDHEAGMTDKRGRPFMIDSCHALASDGPVVRDHWPEWYDGPEAPGDEAGA